MSNIICVSESAKDRQIHTNIFSVTSKGPIRLPKSSLRRCFWVKNTMRILVVIIILHLTAVSTHRQKSDCNYGPGCPFPCHCADGVVCDPLTGCQGACLENEPFNYPQSGWEGYGCQEGNLAYNKTAWQFRWLPGQVASLAVNGLVDRGITDIAQPSGPIGRAWWTVDLGALHTVYSTRIMNTKIAALADYLNHIRVYVSNSSIPDNDTVLNSEDDIMRYGTFVICGEHDERVANGSDADVQCGQPLIGRYILVYKYDALDVDDSRDSFAVSEVTVRGNRYQDCSSCIGECHTMYGCIASCPPGKNQTTLCSADCNDGTFGIDCGGRCSGNCVNDTLCEKTDGTCPGGCALWWAELPCTANIAPPASDIVHTIAAPDVTSGDVTLTWYPLDNISTGLESHYGYIIGQQNHQDQRLETIAGDPWTDIAWINYTGTVDTECYTAKGLDYNSWYSFRLQVYRQDQGVIDIPTDSGTVDVKTICVQPAEPMVTSQVFSHVEGEIEAANITWDLVVPSNSGCDYVNSYIVSYRLVDNTSDLNERFFDNTTNVFLLLPDKSGTHIIRITARNNGGFESYTQIKVNLELHDGQRADDDLLVTAIVGWVCFGVSLVVIVLVAIRHRCGTRSTTSHKKDTSHVTYINSPPPSGTASFHAALDGVYAAPDDLHASPDRVHAAPDRAHAAPDGVNTAPVNGINIVGEDVGTSQMAALPVDNPYEAITEFDITHSDYTGLTYSGRVYQNV